MVACSPVADDPIPLRRGVRARFQLENFLRPDQLRFMDLIGQLERLAPAVVPWLRHQRGPCPSGDPEVAAIVAELQEIRSRLR